ncbi:MAG: AraC family transcriptional regulator [Cyclobacteriaceae bacterium]|nr:AraC family transcriptional regulator [Cyclobacteriaceae bacterium]
MSYLTIMESINFKYLTANQADVEWGLYLRVAGFTTNPPLAPYPLARHPQGYHFSWEKGRILDEFQISYITKGKGILETRDGIYTIAPGSVFIILPGQWHRYKPDQSTGWDEYYIGFRGSYANNIFRHEFFVQNRGGYGVGHNLTLLHCFEDIIEKSVREHPGYQQQIAGRIMSIIGEIIATVKNQEFEGKGIEKRIKEAQFDLRERLGQSIKMEAFAEGYGMSYSYFRKLFKTYTGLSPAQYHLQLKLQKARDMLSTSDKTVKEIAFSLGFESAFHFSKIYKKKYGLSPGKSR